MTDRPTREQLAAERLAKQRAEFEARHRAKELQLAIRKARKLIAEAAHRGDIGTVHVQAELWTTHVAELGELEAGTQPKGDKP